MVETDTDVHQSFIIPTDQLAEFAHRALVILLSTFTQAQQPLSWRQVLVQNQLPSVTGSPQQAARNALDAELLERVIRQRPLTMPEFLKKGAAR